jgi:peptide/nickel transport system ATP-binding protein
MLSLAMMALVPRPGQATAGRLELLGRDVRALDETEWCRIRGRDIGMVFQNPMTGFNPVRTIGRQLSQSLQRHAGLGFAEARERVIDALRDVGIPSPEQRFGAYPHEMSGGQLQRAMIALAMLNRPAVLLADEPTTALDATVQAQILELMRTRVENCGLILVTHDLGVAAQICDRVMVMRHGRVVEAGPCRDVLQDPQHEYTRALLEAAPRFTAQRLHAPPKVSRGAPLLQGRGLRVSFPVGRRKLHAVDEVDLDVWPGETVALVGESGSGKSSTALALMGVHPLDAGELRFAGDDVTRVGGERQKRLRRDMQMVLQNPYGSLDPRWSVRRILTEPLHAHGVGSRASRDTRARELVRQVQLPQEALERLPSQFSGGQRQRISIARSLALSPRVLIADEPVSALDVSIQAQIIRLLMDIQAETGIAYLIISHDLALVHEIADRVVVLYLGRVVEQGTAQAVISAPQHPYTAALISAVPVVDDDGTRQRIVLGGDPPSALDPPAGCPFNTRCPIARDRCRQERPPLRDTTAGGKVACFYPGEVKVDLRFSEAAGA